MEPLVIGKWREGASGTVITAALRGCMVEFSVLGSPWTRVEPSKLQTLLFRPNEPTPFSWRIHYTELDLQSVVHNLVQYELAEVCDFDLLDDNEKIIIGSQEVLDALRRYYECPAVKEPEPGTVWDRGVQVEPKQQDKESDT